MNPHRSLLENKAASLNHTCEQLRENFTGLEKKLRDEFARRGKPLRDKIKKLKKQHQEQKRAAEAKKSQLLKLKKLLSLCNDPSGEPEAYKIVRNPYGAAERPTGAVGNIWIQATERELRTLVKGIQHTIEETIYGVYRDRKSDGMCFAFRLHNGKIFVLRGLLGG